MPINTFDFNKLSNAEVARLYQVTRKEYIKQRDGIDESEASRPRTTGTPKAHLDPSGAVCCDPDCPGLGAHYPEAEKTYVHPDGFIAEMDGQDIPLTAEQRKVRFFESMPDSEVAQLPEADQDALYEWREARIESILVEFIQKTGYHPTEANKLVLADAMSRKYLSVRCQYEDEVEATLHTLLQRGALTHSNLVETFESLFKAGRMDARPGVARPLDADSQRRLSALASSCRTENEFYHCLQTYLDWRGVDISWREAALDSVYSPLVEKAVLWLWEQYQDSYTPSPERRTAIRKYLAGRFPTVKLLNSAWLAVQKQEARGELESDQAAPKLTEEQAATARAQAIVDGLANKSFEGL